MSSSEQSIDFTLHDPGIGLTAVHVLPAQASSFPPTLKAFHKRTVKLMQQGQGGGLPPP